MNRSIIFVAIFLCAGCAHTPSTPKAETDQLAANILRGDSDHPACARDEVSYCKVTRASHFSGAQANASCGCVSKSLFNANARSRVTAPTPGTRVR